MLQNMQPDCRNCANQECFIDRFCHDSWKAKVAQRKTTLTVKRNQPFIFEGSSVTGIYFLYEGKAIVYKGDLADNYQVMRLAKSGDIVGHRGMSPEHRYPISALALDSSKLCFVPFDDFLKALKANPEFCYNLALYYAEELNKAEDKTFRYMKLPVKARVADILLTLLATFGYNPAKKNQLGVLFPRKIIANMAGTTYETLLRLFADFSREKIIGFEGKNLKILKPQDLERFRSQNH